MRKTRSRRRDRRRRKEKSTDATTCLRSGLFSESSSTTSVPDTHSFRLAVAHAPSALSPPRPELSQIALSTSWHIKRRSSASARPGPSLLVDPIHEHGSRRTGNGDDRRMQPVRDGDGSVFVSLPSLCDVFYVYMFFVRPGRAGCLDEHAADLRQLLVLPHQHARKSRCSSARCARLLASVNVRLLPVLHACRR
jgi:hypothetical protein